MPSIEGTKLADAASEGIAGRTPGQPMAGASRPGSCGCAHHSSSAAAGDSEGEGRANSCPAPPRLYSTPRSGNLVFGMVAAALVFAGAAVLFLFNPAQHGFYPICIFHATTGLLCPGCGSLRALHALLHGNIVTAFLLNPLLIGSLPLIAVLGLRAVLSLAGMPLSPLRISGAWLWAGTALVILFGVLRNCF